MSEKGETLTEAMLAALPAHLRPVRSGNHLRAGCPFHGSESQRSLSIDIDTGRFQCFSCAVWGYTEQSRENWKQQHQGLAMPAPWARQSGTDRLRRDGEEPQPVDAAMFEQLQAWQAALPEAAEYLASRRIPLEQARQLGAGVGTLGNARRLVLPHTNPAGRIVSLYGRRIDGGEDHKHHHLSGRQKGWLNAAAANSGELWITEGAFDALALMAAGIPHAAAVFGTQGIRWGWLANVRRLVLALDVDEAGRRAIEQHAKQALMRGLEVLALTPDELGGAKDIAEAWAGGTLKLSNMEGLLGTQETPDPLVRLQALVAALPDAPPAGLPAPEWMDYKATAQRFMREHAAHALALGWTELELFGLPKAGQTTGGGALWLMADCTLRQFTQDMLTGISDQGSPMSTQRMYLTPRWLPWAEGDPCTLGPG